MHVYDSRFPTVAHATVRAPDASLQDYLARRKELGLSRTVVVQPSAYGTDNRCTLTACEQLGEEARAVVTIDPLVQDAAPEGWHEKGVRGLRFGLAPGCGWGADAIAPLAQRAAERGWHVQLTVSAQRLVAMAPLLHALPCPLVIDHMGNVPPCDAVQHPAFDLMRRLVEAGRTWIKLSGAYLQAHTQEDLAQAGQLAARLVAVAPERMLWGTNWPHPTHGDRAPDDRALLTLLAEACGTSERLAQVLVHNPAQVYGFKSATSLEDGPDAR
jgi:predicted TIM-barrel fold metal-dependent hydrolase